MSSYPLYIETFEKGELKEKVEKGIEILRTCTLCPRECKKNRLENEKGTCNVGRYPIVSSYFPHHGEEAPLRGRFGSGTIFFSECNLRCVFCQNYEISHLGEGEKVSPQKLSDMMMTLQYLKCHNINFVTPTHVVPQILEALLIAIEKGLKLPIVYNSGGYDNVETIKLLDGIVDIYMPDIKFMDSEYSKRYMNASDYPEKVKLSLKEMHRQVGNLEIGDDGVAKRGLLVRHLVMPGGIQNTKIAMKFLSEEISPDTYVNIMFQYRPCGEAYKYKEINTMPDYIDFSNAMKDAKDEGIWRFDR